MLSYDEIHINNNFLSQAFASAIIRLSFRRIISSVEFLRMP